MVKVNKLPEMEVRGRTTTMVRSSKSSNSKCDAATMIISRVVMLLSTILSSTSRMLVAMVVAEATTTQSSTLMPASSSLQSTMVQATGHRQQLVANHTSNMPMEELIRSSRCSHHRLALVLVRLQNQKQRQQITSKIIRLHLLLRQGS